ncbi:unnamed protein product [Mytilus edulis]|uniref:Uncharacterized protein n=1 Tax=Mytilus edulis TaxID=6550 RepID=A0A8S3U112_MYTED|nr:unnamed protein product [Mytilus edulis]
MLRKDQFFIVCTRLALSKAKRKLSFNGIDEQTGEVTDDVVKAFIRTELEIVREIPIVKSYRIGKHFDGKIRPIVVKFENRNDRQDIRFAAPKHLKGKPFGVNEHFPHEVVKIRKELLPIHKEARKQNLKSVLKRDKLYIDGELFDKTKHSHLIKQPEAMDEGALKVVETGTRTDGKFSYQINKLDDEAFVSYLKTYDIVILSECWISNDFTFDIEGFKSKCTQGGGLCVMINTIYSPYISFIESIADTFVWLKFDKVLFDFDQDLYVCGAYIPPINSKYHSLYECDIFRLMEDNIISYSSKGKICLVGDLNCRTSNVSDFIEDDTVHITLQNQLPNLFNYSNDYSLSTRINPDTISNDYGSKLIKLCKSTGLRILNGRHKDGLSNDYTYCALLTNLLYPLKGRLLNGGMNTKSQCKEALSNNVDNFNSLCENLNFESQDGIDKTVSDFSEFLNGIMSPYFKVRPKVSTSRKETGQNYACN